MLAGEYRRKPKTIGAYCIRNIDSQQCFVGVSRDVDARLNRHRFMLRSGSEFLSPQLQRDWNALGADRFEFVLLETIEPPDDPNYDPEEDLAMLEEIWLEQLPLNGYTGRGSADPFSAHHFG